MLSRIIHERGTDLPKKGIVTSNIVRVIDSHGVVESTGHNFMGPFVNSPPNDFLRKIQSRMAVLDVEIDIVRNNMVKT